MELKNVYLGILQKIYQYRFSNYCNQNILSVNSKTNHICHVRQYATSNIKKILKENPVQNINSLSASFINKLRSIHEVVINHSSNGEKILHFVSLKGKIPVDVIIKQTAAKNENCFNKELINKTTKIKTNNKNTRIKVSHNFSEVLKVKNVNSEFSSRKIVPKLAETSVISCFKKVNSSLKEHKYLQQGSTTSKSKLNDNIYINKAHIKQNCKHKFPYGVSSSHSVIQKKNTPKTVKNEQYMLLYLKLYPTVTKLHKTLMDRNISSRRYYGTLPRNQDDADENFLQPKLLNEDMSESKDTTEHYENNSGCWDNMKVIKSQMFEKYREKEANTDYNDDHSYIQSRENIDTYPLSQKNDYENDILLQLRKNSNKKYKNPSANKDNEGKDEDEIKLENISAGLIKSLAIAKDTLHQLKQLISWKKGKVVWALDNVYDKMESNTSKLELKNSRYAIANDKFENQNQSNNDESSQHFKTDEINIETVKCIDNENTKDFKTNLKIQIHGEFIPEKDESINKFNANETVKKIKDKFKKEENNFMLKKAKTVSFEEIKPEINYNFNDIRSNKEIHFQNKDTFDNNKPEKRTTEYNFYGKDKYINKITNDVKKENKQKPPVISKSGEVDTVFVTSDGITGRLNFETKSVPEPYVKFKMNTKKDNVEYKFDESVTSSMMIGKKKNLETGISSSGGIKTAVNKEKFINFLKERPDHKFLISKMLQSKSEMFDSGKSDSSDKNSKKSDNLLNLNETLESDSKTNVISNNLPKNHSSELSTSKSQSLNSPKYSQSSPILKLITSLPCTQNAHHTTHRMAEKIEHEKHNSLNKPKNFYNKDVTYDYAWKKENSNNPQFINYFKGRFQSRG